MAKWAKNSYVMREIPGIGLISEHHVEVFWTYCDKQPCGCWEWKRSFMNAGYGQIRVGTAKTWRVVKAHRLAWALTHGAVPPDLQVCHTCDNKKCVNPAHLFLGTGLDNMRDARSKGRMVIRRVAPKLTREQAIEILAANGSQREVGERFGVSSTIVFRIRHGTYGINWDSPA
jgi:hypothetical protein